MPAFGFYLEGVRFNMKALILFLLISLPGLCIMSSRVPPFAITHTREFNRSRFAGARFITSALGGQEL